MRAACFALLAAALSAGCLTERPRPAPPQLSITLVPALIHSPDTLRGTIRATDADGIDSLWLSLDGLTVMTWDGLLDTEFDSPFILAIAKGRTPGTRLNLVLKGLDINGFTGELDTVVTVIP